MGFSLRLNPLFYKKPMPYVTEGNVLRLVKIFTDLVDLDI